MRARLYSLWSQRLPGLNFEWGARTFPLIQWCGRVCLFTHIRRSADLRRGAGVIAVVVVPDEIDRCYCRRFCRVSPSVRVTLVSSMYRLTCPSRSSPTPLANPRIAPHKCGGPLIAHLSRQRRPSKWSAAPPTNVSDNPIPLAYSIHVVPILRVKK